MNRFQLRYVRIEMGVDLLTRHIPHTARLGKQE